MDGRGGKERAEIDQGANSPQTHRKAGTITAPVAPLVTSPPARHWREAPEAWPRSVKSGLRARSSSGRGLAALGFRAPARLVALSFGAWLGFLARDFCRGPARKHGGFLPFCKRGEKAGQASLFWPLGPMLILPSRVSSLMEAAPLGLPSVRRPGEPLARVSLASFFAAGLWHFQISCVFSEKRATCCKFIAILAQTHTGLLEGPSFPS